MKRFRLLLLPLIPLALVWTMANTGCNSGVSVSGGPGGAAVAVPLQRSVGTSGVDEGSWVHIGRNWLLWGTVGSAAGWKVSQVMAAVAKDAGHGAHQTRTIQNLVNSPCIDPSTGKPRSTKHVVSEWLALKTPKAGAYTPKNRNARLDCRGLGRIFQNGPVPGRLKYIYDCIRNILANGDGLVQNFAQVAYDWRPESQSGGWVIVTNGRITEVKPTGGSWGNCARAV